jgi:hypothetical protein
LPTIKLKNIVVEGICSQPGVLFDNIINKQTHRLWGLILDSRGGYDCPTQVPNQHKYAEPSQAQSKIRDSYTIILISVVAGWVLLYLGTATPVIQWLSVFRLISILGLTVSTILVPYTYGKLISPITMPAVHILLREKVEANGTPWFFGENLLVAKYDNSLLVFNISKGTMRLIEIPKIEIKRFEISGTEDALALEMKSKEILPIGVTK